GYGTLLVALNAFMAENSTDDVSLNWWGISSTYPGFTDTVTEPTTTVSAPVVSYTVNGESSESASASIGDTLTLSIDAVTAEDGETVHYQWYSSTSSSESTRSKIDGANGLTYTVDTTKSATVYYWIAVSVQNDYMRTAEVFNDAAIEAIVAFAIKEDGTIDGGTFEIKLKDTANTENSASNPNVIDTVEKLQALAAFMSDKTTAYYFEQYGNLDLGDEAWTPIGTSSNPFIGVYDGANYHVSGLYISDTPESTATYYGLFGYINSATIKNLTVSGEITLGQSSSGSYYGYAGALVGRLYSNSSITDCAVTEDTTISGGQYTGGIAGQVSYSLSAPNSLSNCTSAASVYGGNYAGGITGLSSSYNTFADISNSGTVTSATGPAGGLIGSAGFGEISDSSNTGTVYSADTAGGLIGTTTQSTFEVLNSKNFGEVTGGTYVGGLVGNLIANIVNSYNQGNVIGLSGATAVGGLTGNSSRAIRNCYNVGEVSTAGGDTVFGSLSGLNTSNVTNCFYLTQSGVDALGSDSGAVSYVASFDDANGVLTALDAEAGFAYPGTSLLEQLNGWVANNLSDYSDAMGWTADEGSYPILSNEVDLTGEIPATVTVTMSEENPSKVSMGSETTLTATVTLSDGAIGTVTYQWLRGEEEISSGTFETTAETAEIPASISVETSTFGSYSYTLKVTNTTQTYSVCMSCSATA
ncbi:MAG: hypothetical protein LUF68_05020, partial [Clostridiales bacterium]|nr:hypothetical protein [Clostridiales bacterium]